MNNLFHFPENMSAQERNGFQIALAIAVAHFIAVPYYAYLVMRQTTDSASYLALAAITLALGVFFGIGAVVSRRGRPTQGIILVLGLLAVSYPPIALLVSGLGSVLGIAMMFVGPMSAFQILSRRSGWVVAVITVVSGLATLLIDILGSAARPSLPGIFIPLLATSVVITLIFFIVRQFRDYPLRAKLLLGFLSAVILASLGGAVAYVRQSGTVETTAITEATHLAETVGAFASSDPANLQPMIVRIHKLQGRDLEVIDLDLRIVADAEPAGIGTIVDNSTGEIAATLQDGQKRTFDEINSEFPEGIKQVVVPIKDESGKISGAVVMEYTPLLEELQQVQNRAALSFILINTVGVILALLISQIISSLVANPISKLSDAALKIGEGQLDTSLPNISSKDEIGILANAFNSMTSQLRELITSLEQRVAARTRDLEIVAEVGTATATILESKRLLQEVVDLTKERFNLYHSHIYLLDEEGKNLVLAAGAGEPGRVMAAEKRSIPLDREQSLVARAARERNGVTVNDVTQAPDFLPNPLLPDTRSELAVPMIVGGNVIGVFDIQSDQVGRFTESDVNLQTTMAAQLATSIQNVRSFEQSKKQAELESMVNAIGQKIQRTASMEDTLQTAIREIGMALGASRVHVNISAPQNDGHEASHN